MGNTTPKGLPQTPPASTRKAHGAKPIPKFQLPEEAPSTLGGGSSAGHVQLRTPATSRRKSIFSTPQTTNNKVLQGTALFMPSPDVTPQRSPRGKRKKISFESFLPVSDSISVLLPNHSSVGSGRRHADAAASTFSKATLSLDLAELFKINRNLGFEQDIAKSPSKRGRPRKTVPVTPGKQLITEEKIHSWHGRSFHLGFSSDEDDDDTHTHTGPKLANPFLSTSSEESRAQKLGGGLAKTNPFGPKTSTVDYSTHLELINHRTGERKIEALLEEQKKFKPKKIDFSGI